MSRNFENPRKRGGLSISIGWLFADMLLVLAVLFLAANTIIFPTPKTPPPTPIPPTPTSIPLPSDRILERNYCRIVFNDPNPDQFGNDLNFAKSTLEPQVNRVNFLQNREVGIAIAAGGLSSADFPNQIDRSVSVAKNVYSTLQDLGRKGLTFKKTSYYDPIYTQLYISNQIVIDVYLVAQAGRGETCNSKHLPV